MKVSIRTVWLFGIMALWLFSLFLAGCVPSLTIAGSGVWTTEEPKELSNCKFLGHLEAKVDMPPRMASYALTNKLKNQTGAMGGNWLLIKEYIPESRDGAKMVGEAYYCLDKIPTY